MKIGLESAVTKKIVEGLNQLLAAEFVLYLKTLKCHWNVVGKHFGALHLFFKEQYEQLFIVVDDVAERVRALNHFPPATVQEYAKFTLLKEHPGQNPDDLSMIAWLIDDHETIIRTIRTYIDETADLKDMGTNNFLCDLIEQHEKMVWMLRAFLQSAGTST